jgi:hypothetical protein
LLTRSPDLPLVVRVGSLCGVGDRAVPAGLVIVGICAGVGVLGITGAAIWAGFWGLGTPRDRAAANQLLQLTAALLGGRFRARREYPWYQRPAQYGGIEGELYELEYELYLMPRNAEYCSGAAMLQIRSPQGHQLVGNGSRLRVFTPEGVWRWPDRADPGTLAGYVRQAIAAAASGEMSQEAS